MLRKYVPDPQHVINFQTIEVQEDVSYEKMSISILSVKGKDYEEPINSSCENAKAATLVRRDDVGIRRRYEASLSLIIRVIRCEFGEPNSFKKGRNCNDPSQNSSIYSAIN